MNITLGTAPLNETRADAMVVGLWEGEPPDGPAAELDRLLDRQITDIGRLAGEGEVAGRKDQCTLLFTGKRLAAPRVLLVGLGKRANAGPNTLREAAGVAARFLRDRKAKRVASALHRAAPGKRLSKQEVANGVEAVVEGTLVGVWEPDAYRAEDARKGGLDTLAILEPDERWADSAREGIARGQALGESENFARTLANEPGNELPPLQLAERARQMAGEVGLGYEALDEDAMYRLGMGALLSVSVGSENRACLVVLRHMPEPGDPVLALVGKGITFDTGGISIKPTEGMGAMKGDMAGAAAVLGAMRAIALLKLPINVVGLAPCAENMPSGKAYRPGDVVRAMNGKTVEIITTDAEGRLVLADALTYAIRNLHAKYVVDVATLTGACVIALGHVATGAITNNAELLGRLRAAADAAGERVWELPNYDEYKKQIQSDIADLKNSGGRPGGAVTAGLFLREFVDDTPWVHLDIAGTSTADGGPAIAKGPTAAMVRTFVRLAEKLATE